MTTTDNAFFEEYKRLDRICPDMYSTSGGISQYIQDMEDHFSDGARLVDGWKQIYGVLKHLRWVRNRIAHEVSESPISCDQDLKMLREITSSILRQDDPLALLDAKKNFSYTSSQYGQRTTVVLPKRKIEVGKSHMSNAKSANKKGFLNKTMGILLNVFAALSCLISLYAGLVIEQGQMRGSPWPTLVTALLCWLLVALIRHNRKREPKSIICSLALCVCFLSALAASGYTICLMVKIFPETYKTIPSTVSTPGIVEAPQVSGFSLLILLVIVSGVIRAYKVQLEKKRIRDLVDHQSSMTPQQFIRLKSSRGFPPHLDVPGIYILHNVDKDKNYVGQSQHVLTRVNQHFTGNGGNADVYADYKYHDRFEISIARFEGSGYSTLNEMERETIKAYNAYTRGYNKTRGNKN